MSGPYAWAAARVATQPVAAAATPAPMILIAARLDGGFVVGMAIVFLPILTAKRGI